MSTSLMQRDLQHIWHPCTQMKDHEKIPLLEVESAKGSYLYLKDGRKIIDAISSWWCKSLGHGHPVIKQAILEQLEKFEHVILAGTTNDVIVNLSEQLAGLLPPLSKVLYAGDGSCAVEMAMKLSLHAQQIKGQSQRTQFIALQNDFHGETAGAMSVSELGIYRDAYESMLFPVNFIEHIPYVSGKSDSCWHDCHAAWQKIEQQLAALTDTTAAVIVEPVVQGAAGMLIYSPDLLKRLRKWCDEYGIYLIADEIMTGLGRTGKMFAVDHANIKPDFVCLSKGLTSGTLPISVVLTQQHIYDLFYDDYSSGKSFLHSHTYSGNALAASVALATLQVMQDENIVAKSEHVQTVMLKNMQEINNKTNLLTNIRGIGGIVAADLRAHNAKERLGLKVYQQAIKRGALLRPLGNTIYWLPPLNVNDETLHELKNITLSSLKTLQKKVDNGIKHSAESDF